LEFKIETLAPILFVGRVLSFELFPKFGFTLVPVPGEPVLDFGFSSMTVCVEIMLHSVFEFVFYFGLEAS
jgi:hypothetical protein